MNGERPARIALLIDADNSPAAKIDLILTELATLGVANVRRAYGNWKKDALKGWEKVLHEHAIRPMQQFDYSKGKNASDMAMVIDALELLYTDQPDAFGIVSSDADFTPLVMHLRAKGAAVYGFGNHQAPAPFVNACSRFLYLDKVDAGSSAGQQRMSPAQLRQDAKLISLLRHAVQAAGGEEGWAQVGVVAQQIRNQASVDARNYGYPTFSRLLEATQLFELRREGSVAWVRDRREGRAEPRQEARTEPVRNPEPAAARSTRVERPQSKPEPEGVRMREAPVEDAVAAVVASLLSEPEAQPPAEAPTPRRRSPRRKAEASPAAEAAPTPEAAAPTPKPRARRTSKPKA
ncbi:uncharacterized LabA/DUF88 family protein [Inhella inkyongensis]|uniref:Uncharacterized LabA/DUF88 family protein n=1 Tax=Inhella inkyongensis TaxID=392593 RepID=A0A840S457_9BURK|nr:uncharacterized LabA/DUF88 family protein [Inhella inkyongensis]